MGLVRQTWILFRHDLRQEARDFELVLGSAFFSLVVLALFAVAFATLAAESQRAVVPGLLWLAMAFVGALTLTRVFDREREHDTLRALLVAPVDRLAIYLAKGAFTLVVLVGCAVVLLLGLSAVFPAARAWTETPWLMLAVVVFGCAGYVAVGTLFAAGLATKGGKNVLLTLVLYPLSTPVLLFSLVATRAVLDLHPGATTYTFQLLALDVLLWAMGAWLFEPVLVGHPARQARLQPGRMDATRRPSTMEAR